MPRFCGAMATDSALPGFRWGFTGVSETPRYPATSCHVLQHKIDRKAFRDSVYVFDFALYSLKKCLWDNVFSNVRDIS